MSASLLLRILLCLLLVLNGVGNAVAGVRMSLEHSARAEHSLTDALASALGESVVPAATAAERQLATDAGPPCHEAKQAAVEQPPADGVQDNCCDAGQCACACLQHVLATPMPAALPAAIPGSERAGRRLQAGHLPPALSHLIRPPIG